MIKPESPLSAPSPPAAVNAAADSESRYFDSVVAEEGEFNPFLDAGWNTLRQRFETMIQPKSGSRILDVGCGTGQSRQLYIAHAGKYTGIDLSQNAVDTAAQRFPDSEWLRADACALPFADNSFDIVAFSSVLHHIPDFGRALSEAHRVLTPGGKAFAFDPNLLHPAMALFRDPKSRFYKPEGVSPNERPLHPRELWKAFEVAGFEELQQRAQSHIPYRAVMVQRLNAMLKAYNAVDYVWEAIGLGSRYGTFVITVGRK